MSDLEARLRDMLDQGWRLKPQDGVSKRATHPIRARPYCTLPTTCKRFDGRSAQR